MVRSQRCQGVAGQMVRVAPRQGLPRSHLPSLCWNSQAIGYAPYLNLGSASGATELRPHQWEDHLVDDFDQRLLWNGGVMHHEVLAQQIGTQAGVAEGECVGADLSPPGTTPENLEELSDAGIDEADPDGLHEVWIPDGLGHQATDRLTGGAVEQIDELAQATKQILANAPGVGQLAMAGIGVVDRVGHQL